MSNMLAKTLSAVRLIIKKKQTRGIFLLSSTLYLLVYLFAIGDLSFNTAPYHFVIRWSDQPFSLIFKSISPFYFEAIALIKLFFLTYLFSPLNLFLAGVLSLLVGFNIAFSYLAFTQPKVCYGQSTVGILAALPALLAGSACCGPLILLVLGIQASAALMAFFGWLIPVAILLLVGALLLNGHRMNLSDLENR
ncbi:hypothetical protein [Nitrosococcus wardiae]|uniref:Uncharacterized protein n=1 Tax=Nitrosococcus wardiae TaxID=1814290 RepID=A0A4V1AVU2_9GAMM|nr:hypothetical protein [Nitrosococcus wardiae]QBQ54325.1 hypothetical protein E3U44_07235 [Nitrosococcus wardiae]